MSEQTVGMRDALTGATEQLHERMGIEITEWDPERLVGTMPVAGNRQPYGLLHGGASAVLAETLGSIAAVLNAGEGRVALGIELSVSHHRAVRDGLVTGICTPLHRGSSVATYQILLTDDQDKPICTARLTCVVRKAPQPT